MNEQIFQPEEIEYHGKRVRRVVIDMDTIIESLLTHIEDRNDYNYYPVYDIVPKDVKLIGNDILTNMHITFYLEHESFEVFDDLDGRLPPVMTPSVRRETR